VTAVALVALRRGTTPVTAHDIREVAVMRVAPETGEPSETYFARLRPMHLESSLSLPRGSVWLAEAMNEIRERTRGCVLAGTDPAWTRAMLEGACVDWELAPLDLAEGVLDLSSLGWPLVLSGDARSTSVDDLADACGVIRLPRATALDDVALLGDLYRRLVRRTQPPLSLAGFSPDEQKIVSQIIARIADGRRTYGPWRVDDGRNNPREALAEVMDALNYCAAELVRLGAVGGVQ
jgi:hypothetical protein